jgi:hypothetical protein
MGDPESSLGHLQRWNDETGGDAVARIWHTQAICEISAGESALTAIATLTAALHLDPNQNPNPELRSVVVSRLREAGPSIAYFPRKPFWESDAFRGSWSPTESDHKVEVKIPPLDGNYEQPRDATGASPDQKRHPRVFVANNVWFQRAQLAEILTDEGIEVLYCSPIDGLLERLSREALPIELILFPLTSGIDADLEMLAKIREIPLIHNVPVLGVSTVDRAGLDFDKLRLLGVVGLIDQNALPEHVAFRVNSVVRKSETEGRRFERAPAFFAVDITTNGQTTCEYATNLSCGGLRVASSRALPKGTEVSVRFRLPSSAGRLIEASGHVTWIGKTNRSDMPRHLLGIFFDPLGESDHELVGREARSILSLSHW